MTSTLSLLPSSFSITSQKSDPSRDLVKPNPATTATGITTSPLIWSAPVPIPTLISVPSHRSVHHPFHHQAEPTLRQLCPQSHYYSHTLSDPPRLLRPSPWLHSSLVESLSSGLNLPSLSDLVGDECLAQPPDPCRSSDLTVYPVLHLRSVLDKELTGALVQPASQSTAQSALHSTLYSTLHSTLQLLLSPPDLEHDDASAVTSSLPGSLSCALPLPLWRTEFDVDGCGDPTLAHSKSAESLPSLSYSPSPSPPSSPTSTHSSINSVTSTDFTNSNNFSTTASAHFPSSLSPARLLVNPSPSPFPPTRTRRRRCLVPVRHQPQPVLLPLGSHDPLNVLDYDHNRDHGFEREPEPELTARCISTDIANKASIRSRLQQTGFPRGAGLVCEPAGPESEHASTQSFPTLTNISHISPRLLALASNFSASLRAVKSAASTIYTFNLPSIPLAHHSPPRCKSSIILSTTTDSCIQNIHPPNSCHDRLPTPPSPPSTKSYTASIQMRTYRIKRSPYLTAPPPSAPPPVLGHLPLWPRPSPVRPASPAVLPPLPTMPLRPRESRENPDFIRIAVMEMAMRRSGKLDDRRPGRARWLLPPRRSRPPAAPAAPTADRVPARWVPVTL